MKKMNLENHVFIPCVIFFACSYFCTCSPPRRPKLKVKTEISLCMAIYCWTSHRNPCIRSTIVLCEIGGEDVGKCMRHLYTIAVLLDTEKSTMFNVEQGMAQGCSVSFTPMSPKFNHKPSCHTVSYAFCTSKNLYPPCTVSFKV